MSALCENKDRLVSITTEGTLYMTVMDEKGKIVREGAVNNHKGAAVNFLTEAQCDSNSTAVVEASRDWPVMYDWLEELMNEVRLAHPVKGKGGNPEGGEK